MYQTRWSWNLWDGDEVLLKGKSQVLVPFLRAESNQRSNLPTPMSFLSLGPFGGKHVIALTFHGSKLARKVKILKENIVPKVTPPI